MKHLALALLLAFALPAKAQQIVPSKGGTMTINLLGPITSASMAELVRAAQDAVITGAEEVQIQISSGGGKVYAARFAVNSLAALPIKISTVAMSDVSSSAVALFCAGETRYAGPGSSIYLHQLTRFAERSMKTAAAQEREDAIVNGWYDSMLTRCLADPVDFRLIESYKERDMILDSADIRRLGMSNAPFDDLRKKRYFGRATNIVPRTMMVGSEGRR